MNSDAPTGGSGLRLFRVGIAWTGGVEALDRLFSALAHLEPALSPGARHLTVDVTAPSTHEAETYVTTVLRRAGLDRSARVIVDAE